MKEPIIIPPKRLYFHCRKVFWIWKWDYTVYPNKHFNNKLWHCLDEWTVYFGFKTSKCKWFDIDDWYYDGHYGKSIIFFGIVIGYNYSYDAQQLQTDKLDE